jgi:hypothetical protein
MQLRIIIKTSNKGDTMHYFRLVAILILAATLRLNAQTPIPATPPAQPAPPASGPTMEQTIAFINDAFTKQGVVFWDNNKQTGQSAHLESPCVLAYSSTQYINGIGEPITLDWWKIDLEKDDPRNLKIDQHSTYYVIQINRSAYSDDRNLAVASLGVFRDKSTTERVAKAYIHAMVLCHKPETP